MFLSKFQKQLGCTVLRVILIPAGRPDEESLNLTTLVFTGCASDGSLAFNIDDPELPRRTA
jgi:hypothetical protein